MRGKYGLFLLGWAMVLAGGLLAHLVQTSGGVRVEEVRYRGPTGTRFAALLYVPATATAARPAPAVMASHGYINTREMQGPFAIELARRGFVVLAIDMAGHGYSGGAVGAEDGGGPAGLAYLQSLPFVDRTRIGLEGHSMGGVPVVGAALAQPGGYRSMVLEGSTTPEPGQMGAGTPTFPRNLEVVFGRFDEFAPLMWHVAKGADVGRSAKLETLFGVAAPVAPGRIYGDMGAGTARRLVVPPIIHPLEHFSTAGVGAAIDWFHVTLGGEANPLPASDQIWPWKEAGTLLALVGFVVLLLGTFELLLETRLFGELRRTPAAPTARRGPRWLVAFLLTTGIPALSFYAFTNLGYLFTPSGLFPEWVTNQLLVWAVLNAIIGLALALVFGARITRPESLGKAIAIAVAVVSVGYAALALDDTLFKVDFRFWIVGLKRLDSRHFTFFLAYLAPFTLAFAATLKAWSANLPVRGETTVQACLWGAASLASGFAVLLLTQYGTMLATGALITPKEALSTIIAIQFVPILTFVGLVAAYTFRRTGSVLPGAFICGLVVTWYIVAGTATHWSPGWRPPTSAGLYPDRPAGASKAPAPR